MKESFAVIALALSITGNIPYIYETIKGKVKPERISWLLWTLLGITYYISAVREDGAQLFTLGELIGPGLILGLSLFFGVGGRSRFDQVSLVIALTAFGLLFVTDNTLISLFLALSVDAIGALLTIRKLKEDPASESRGFWLFGVLSSIFALLSLNTLNIETLSFPIYVLVLSAYILSQINPNKEANVDIIEKL